jgi:hypothetical protein
MLCLPKCVDHAVTVWILVGHNIGGVMCCTSSCHGGCSIRHWV